MRVKLSKPINLSDSSKLEGILPVVLGGTGTNVSTGSGGIVKDTDPILKGSPKTPKPPATDSSDRIASTSFVKEVATRKNLGVDNVENYPIASDAEAIAGTATDRYMTPALVKLSIGASKIDVNAGDLGTYGFLYYTGTVTIAPNEIVQSTELAYDSSDLTGEGLVPTGSWKAMSVVRSETYGLFYRVS